MPHPTIATLNDLDYPESDGQPVAETEFQFNPILNAVGSLRIHFQHRQDVYVVGNLLLYYEEGNQAASVAPDVFVAFGVPNHTRRTYLLWQEGKTPDFVLEVTSQSTRQADQGRKWKGKLGGLPNRHAPDVPRVPEVAAGNAIKV